MPKRHALTMTPWRQCATVLSWANKRLREIAVKTMRILIVDDQPRARQSVKALLATHLHQAEWYEASSGPEALSRVEELRPQIVLMDARMPEMDGVEATRLIRVKWPQVRVIVLSMYGDYRAAAMAAGARAFVSKGEPPERLLAALEGVVSSNDKKDAGDEPPTS